MLMRATPATAAGIADKIRLMHSLSEQGEFLLRGLRMIRVPLVSVLLIFLASSPAAQPEPDQTHNVVKEDSKIEFHTSATFGKVDGEFHSWQADLKMPTENFQDASLELQIEADSVKTGSGLKDKEAKGKNFFAVKEFPHIHFVSKGILPGDDPLEFKMEGELTLRGITKPVSMLVTVAPVDYGHQRIDGNFSFNRRDFGMTHNVPFNKVSDTIKVHMDLSVENSSASSAQKF
jgi:polyisoprenoid-binding protein YceI